MEEKSKKSVKEISCVVTSAKMTKSRVASIERLVRHGTYGKYIRRRTKLMFHDEKNESQEGDKVVVVQARPMSARKRFELLRIVERKAE